jgi:hypothetical protein
MSKIVAAIVFAAVTVLTGSAHATPSTITFGEILGFGSALDTVYDFGGADSEGVGFGARGITLGVVPLEVYGSGVNSIPLEGTNELSVGEVTCFGTTGPGGPDPQCFGFIQLTNTPITPAPDFNDPMAFTVGSAPFTATGHLNVGDRVDFVGQGVVESTFCGGPPNCPRFEWVVRYTFTVDEAPTLFLTLASLGALGALFSVRLLRDR